MRMQYQNFCAILCVGLSLSASSQADTIWSEDFSDVSDWSVIFDPGTGSSITSDGNLGSFHVPSDSSEAAFGPTAGVAPFVGFNINASGDYSLRLVVDSFTASTSYDVRLDEFDDNMNYLSTVFGVLSQGTFAGTTNISLGGFSFNGATAFVLPKVSVFTGTGDQTVRFDEISFAVVPEPASFGLVLCGLVLVAAFIRRKRGLQ